MTEYINHLTKLRSNLTKEEMIFIIDFMINLLKHCTISDSFSVSLSTHLLNDMTDRNHLKFDGVIKKGNAELLYTNFDMRFKCFMAKFANYNKLVC